MPGIIILLVGIGVMIALSITIRLIETEQTRKNFAALTPAELAAFNENEAKRKQLQVLSEQYGSTNSELFCPHCQTKGKVRAKGIKKKTGISGGKATAAVLTGGVSLLATGLSKKEDFTECHCDNCGSTWSF